MVRLGRGYPVSRYIHPPKAPVIFDAAGAGAAIVNGNPATWTHVAAAKSYGLIFVTVYQANAISSVTWGGTTVPLLGSVNQNNNASSGYVSMYGLASPPSGSQTVTVTMAVSVYVTACSVSYLNVLSVGTPQTAFGLGTALSHAMTDTARQMIVHGFGGASGFSANGGGNTRYVYTGTATSGLVIHDNAASTTFTATQNQSIDWGAIGAVLQ